MSAHQPASAPGKSRQGVWLGGIDLTIVGGAMIIGGQGRLHDDPEQGCGGFLGCSSVRDPNNALIGAGAAAVGAGIIMIFLGRSKPAPQIIATPGKFAIRHTVKF